MLMSETDPSSIKFLSLDIDNDVELSFNTYDTLDY
jgi:hypothetical protein